MVRPWAHHFPLLLKTICRFDSSMPSAERVIQMKRNLSVAIGLFNQLKKYWRNDVIQNGQWGQSAVLAAQL